MAVMVVDALSVFLLIAYLAAVFVCKNLKPCRRFPAFHFMGNSLFSQIPVIKPKRNFFDLSHDVKLTTEMGRLTPSMWLECYPGDSFDLNCIVNLKFAPLIAPIMHLIQWYVHYFFVPYRIMWPNWEKYYQSPTDTSGDPAPVWPYLVYGASIGGSADQIVWEQSELGDYIGVPKVGVSDVDNIVAVNAMPFAAYGKVIADYFADENFFDATNLDSAWQLVDGNNGNTIGPHVAGGCANRAWEKDYFTSALPFAQKGPTVNIPIGTLEDVRVFTNHASPYTNTLTGSPDNQVVAGRPSTNPDIGADNLYANTENMELEGTSVNDWRRAIKLQEFLERMARGGTRPTEITRSVFGVTPPDYRLQRAEYITGARGVVDISEVLATASFSNDTVDLPQGNQSGVAHAVGGGYSGKYFCTEHGIIMGILSILPKPAYKDGVFSPLLRKLDALDGLAWPQFGNLGEQPIKNVEVYADTSYDQDETFGYTPRYAQYKYMPNRVAGAFRSTLAYWTMVRDFTPQGDVTVPLNGLFVTCIPTKDIFAVVDSGVDSVYAHIFHSVKSKRCFPKWGVPSI